MDKKKTIQVLIGALVFLTLGCIYLISNQSKQESSVVTEDFADSTEQSEEKVISSKEEITKTIYVHICGEVKKPGVYTFSKEPRVIDVIEKAGGVTKKAEQNSINMAESVSDGTQIVIQKKQKKTDTKKEEDSNKININKASQEELMTLSGIGESKAKQILSYRESNGSFKKVEDIMNISGIKEGVFMKIKDYITI